LRSAAIRGGFAANRFVAALLAFAPPGKHLASFGVHKMDELTGETTHQLVRIFVAPHCFIHGVALDAETGVRGSGK
jgi:hypothetical protein